MIIILHLLYTYTHNFEDSQKLSGANIYLYLCRFYMKCQIRKKICLLIYVIFFLQQQGSKRLYCDHIS